jgi:hypothetical protein
LGPNGVTEKGFVSRGGVKVGGGVCIERLKTVGGVEAARRAYKAFALSTVYSLIPSSPAQF